MIARALPSALFSPQRVTQLLAGTASLGDILTSLVTGFGLTLVLVMMACFVFQRQEL